MPGRLRGHTDWRGLGHPAGGVARLVGTVPWRLAMGR